MRNGKIRLRNLGVHLLNSLIAIPMPAYSFDKIQPITEAAQFKKKLVTIW